MLGNTFVRIPLVDLFTDTLTHAEFSLPLGTYWVQAPAPLEGSAPLGRTRALHRYASSVGIIEYLVIALAVVVVVFAVLVSATVYAVRFRWKISRADALTETLPRDNRWEEEG
jgi:hypothetical protein